MFIVAQSDDDKDPSKEMDLDMSVYDFNEGEKHGEIVSEEVAPDGTKTRTIRITQKKSQIVTQAHMCNYCNYTSPKVRCLTGSDYIFNYTAFILFTLLFIFFYRGTYCRAT